MEQSALAQLSVWYLDFVTERALSLHRQDDPEVVQSGFDRLLEVADTIIQAQRPSDCVGQSSESGELEAGPGKHAPLDDDVSSPAPLGTVDEPELPFDPVSAIEDATVLPDGLVEALQSQDWRGALNICESAALGAGSTQGARLSAIARAIERLRDVSDNRSALLSRIDRLRESSLVCGSGQLARAGAGLLSTFRSLVRIRR